MRYPVIGTLTVASIVLGSFAALKWALQGAIALAWTTFAFGVFGVFVLIACLWLYFRAGVGDARQKDPRTAFGPARDRAQERAWMRQPPTAAGSAPSRATSLNDEAGWGGAPSYVQVGPRRPHGWSRSSASPAGSRR